MNKNEAMKFIDTHWISWGDQSYWYTKGPEGRILEKAPDGTVNFDYDNQLNWIFTENEESFVVGVHNGFRKEAEKEESEKPPLGLIPEKIYREIAKKDRLKAIDEAIDRYQKAGLEINADWIAERNIILRSLKKSGTKA